jgi:transcriptional regulator with XRE-family HTH domain
MVKLARLKSLRQRKALTQQELADKAGVTRSTVARVEGSAEEPFPTTIRKLAEALGVRPEDLGPDPADPAAPDASRPESHRRPPSALIDVVREGHLAIAGGKEIIARLEERPELELLIAEAAEQLRRLIPDARLRLSLSVDPDYGEDHQLFLGVSTHLSEAEALLALRRFDRNWWVHHVRRADGLLCIDLDDE